MSLDWRLKRSLWGLKVSLDWFTQKVELLYSHWDDLGRDSWVTLMKKMACLWKPQSETSWIYRK